MQQKKSEKMNNERHDPWISFSDLFCGLLLVFVLLFFFATLKYLEAKEQNDKDTKALQAEMISEQDEVLAGYIEDLERQQGALGAQSEELESQKAVIAASQEEIDSQMILLAERESELLLANETVAEQESELEASRIQILDQQEKLNAQQALLDEQALRLEEIVGVRKALITELNQQMVKKGIQVQADPTTGAIAFESEILFDFDRSILKGEGKDFFSEFMPVYMEVLLRPEFRDYIGEIIIEGHTDQKGDFFHNLQLSQQRAYSVAEFILQNQTGFLEDDVLEELRGLISVNGCADKELIYKGDGSVDEEKSRRVEVKFRLKDQEMIDEMEDILNS